MSRLLKASYTLSVLGIRSIQLLMLRYKSWRATHGACSWQCSAKRDAPNKAFQRTKLPCHTFCKGRKSCATTTLPLNSGVMRSVENSVNPEILRCFKNVKDSANAALAHYQIWFTLRGNGKALKNHYEDMNDYRYSDFFSAANIGNYKLMFIESACLFDRDAKTDGLQKLKALLKKSELKELVKDFDSLKPYSKLVSDMKTVRNKIIAHKDSDVDPKDLYKKHGITPNRIRALLNTTVTILRKVEHQLNNDGSVSSVGRTDRWEAATFGLLKVLKNGRRT